MPRPHGISKRSFCTTGSIWLPRKSCAERDLSWDRQRAFAMLVPRAKPATAKGSFTKTCCFALTPSPPDPILMQPLSPEHNFLLHQISERANLILDARGLF